MKCPSAKRLSPHVRITFKRGAGGKVRLGRYIVYEFTERMTPHSELHQMMKDQCVLRAKIIFTLDDKQFVITNSTRAKAGTIKKDILRLVGY